jgi:hypothetical protein
MKGSQGGCLFYFGFKPCRVKFLMHQKNFRKGEQMRYKKYHLVFISLLIYFLSVSNINAQTSYLDSLDGKFALQFQISENFTLTDFQGAILSGKYHLSNRSAVRLGLSMKFSDSDAEASFIEFDSLLNNKTISSSLFGFGINAQYLYYLQVWDVIGFYSGIGPFINYEFREITSEDYSKGEDLSIGLDAIAGVEWSFIKFMSFSAEYGFQFYYFYRTSNSKSNNSTSEATVKSWIFSADQVKFGISVYF